jgi:hypothetical protein
MVSCFGAMHAIAVKRGDGLRPELVDLLSRSRVNAELEAKSSFPSPDYDKAATETQVSPDAHQMAAPGDKS